MRVVLIVSCLLLFCGFAGLARAGDVKDAVVKIYTVNQRYNYHEPWQMQGQGSFQGSGTIISGNRILTNAHVVSDQTFIQVRRAGQAKKYTAELVMVGHESDLAILSVQDDSFFAGVDPVEIGGLSAIRDRVAVYGFPEGGDILSITEGIVSRVEHSSYNHSGAYLLTCQIDASINSGNSGGPVISGDRVVGVAFQGLSSQQFDNIGYMVPAPVIEHFLEDIKDGVHDGTPELGITTQKMENPSTREYYGMSGDMTGVLVVKIYPDSPAEGILEPQDIILSIDGVSLAGDGTVEFRKNERTFFGYTLQRKQIHDVIELEIIRKRKPMKTEIRLSRAIDYNRLVPRMRFDVAPSYYVAGGLVFAPLTLNYLMEFGGPGNWYVNAPTELFNAYVNGEPTRDQRQIVILVKVLADEINIGYHNSHDVVIAGINGRKISTISDVVEAFEKHDGAYHVVEDIRGYRMVLSTKSVDEKGAKILKRYKIPSDRSIDLAITQ